MRRLCANIALLAVAGCVAAEGDVLTSGSAGDGDGGASGNCAEPVQCPTPAPGQLTVCGQIIDLETSAPVTDDAPDVRVYDLIDLQIDPTGAVARATVEPDRCGQFVASVDGGLGVTVVHTGDLLPTGPFRRVASLITSSPGQAVRVNAFALRAETDARWSQSAGLGTDGFAPDGALMGVFIDLTGQPVAPFQGSPTAGVTISADSPAQAYYFSDAEPSQRSAIDPARSQTGATGAALLSSPSLIIGDSFGGQGAGCNFASSPGFSMAGLIQVQELIGACN